MEYQSSSIVENRRTKSDPVLLENTFSLETYSKRPIIITHGKDALLYDSNGKEYIDGIGGWGSANIGHGNKQIAMAIQEQASRLITCPSILYNEVRAELLEKLVGLTGLSKAFLTNSGTESIEAALKFAIYSTGNSHFIAMNRGFHGRTTGALTLTQGKKYREGFLGFIPAENVTHVPLNKIDALEDAIQDNTAGIVLELIQGEGGINIADLEYVRRIRGICNEKGVLLIIDEVQTGFARTGKMFAFEHYGVQPDILCLAKSIAGGIPMGAILVSESISSRIGLHGSTFGGNPLTCKAALASIEFIEENNLVEQAEKLGNFLLAKLKDSVLPLKKVRSIRGMGLMIGIELKTRVHPIVNELMERGILVIPTGKTVIRLLPPLVIAQSQIDSIVDALVQVLS